MSGLGCGVSTAAEARARWEAGALFRASHGGGEVAAAELGWAAWQGEERSSAEGSGPRGRGGAACGGGDAGAGLRPSSAAGAAAQRRRAEKQRGRDVEDEGWTSL